MRVCNIPMLILTLDALQSAKMDKVYIYANHSFQQIQSSIQSSRYSFQLQFKQTASITEGDVLREADALELKHNFLLIRVGYLGNLDLAKLLRDFAAKRKQDSNLVLDSVLMPSSTSTTFSESPTYAITPTTRLAHFQPPSDSAKRIKIPREIVEEGLLHAGGLTIRSDLHSIGVDVCSPDVCPLFSENFDWMNLRTHFTVGVLTSDLLGKTISCSIVGEHPTVNAGFGRFVESAIYVQDGQTLLEAK